MMKHIKTFFSIVLIAFCGSIFATQNQDALLTQRKVDLERGFQAPSFVTNFQSETLFSGATIGNKTMHITRPSAWRLTKPISYIPASASATPLIKVTCSAVVIDLNGMTISNASVGSTNIVGIEIGYSPLDAATNLFGLSGTPNFTTAVTQPQNVIIKNGTLQDFGIGIVVHAGVKNVVLENIVIQNSGVGIVCAGTAEKNIDSVFVHNVQIVGTGADTSALVSWAQEQLESDTDAQMRYNIAPVNTQILSRLVNPTTGNTDLLSYSGILVQNSNNILLEHVGCKNLGYAGDAYSDSDTGTCAIDIKNSTNIFLDHVDASNNIGEKLVVGIKIMNSDYIAMDHVICNGNIGPDLTYSKNVVSVGSWNTASCVGLWLTSPSYVSMKNIVCDHNSLQAATANAYVFGMLLDNPTQVTIDGLSASGNAGNALGAGIFVYGGQNVTIQNGVCNANSSVTSLVSTAVAQITPNGNISKHTVLPSLAVNGTPAFTAPESLKGSYGVWVNGTTNVQFDSVQANQNTGFRAFGFALQDCLSVRMNGCQTNGQAADGDLFLTGASANLAITTGAFPGNNVDIIPVTGSVAPDIFGSTLTAIYEVDLQAVVLNILGNSSAGAQKLKNNLEVNPPTHTYAIEANFAQMVMLARATIAQWRAWGVAVGVQCNNCTDVSIQDHQAHGNTSDQDSACGILFANRCQNVTVQNAVCNNNNGWQDSQISSTSTVDVSAMAPLWSALDIRTTVDGALTGAVTTTRGSRYSVHVTDDSTRELCTPCGPVTAGIIIGDTSEFIKIYDSICSGNSGNAGHAYGILHDISTGSVVQNCQTYLNTTNTLGIAFGIAEFTSNSSAIHLSNLLYGNQYDTKRNANYLVPFSDLSKSFPLLQGESGSISGGTFNGATDLKNIEILLLADAPTNITNIPSAVSSAWTTGVFAASSMSALALGNGRIVVDALVDWSDSDPDITVTLNNVLNDGTGSNFVWNGWELYLGTISGSNADGTALIEDLAINELAVAVGGSGTMTKGSATLDVTLTGTVYVDVALDGIVEGDFTLGATASAVNVLLDGVQIATINIAALDVGGFTVTPGVVGAGEIVVDALVDWSDSNPDITITLDNLTDNLSAPLELNGWEFNLGSISGSNADGTALIEDLPINERVIAVGGTGTITKDATTLNVTLTGNVYVDVALNGIVEGDFTLGATASAVNVLLDGVQIATINIETLDVDVLTVTPDTIETAQLQLDATVDDGDLDITFNDLFAAGGGTLTSNGWDYVVTSVNLGTATPAAPFTNSEFALFGSGTVTRDGIILPVSFAGTVFLTFDEMTVTLGVGSSQVAVTLEGATIANITISEISVNLDLGYIV